jgi:ribulose bisphosphate carboxylase small subunit
LSTHATSEEKSDDSKVELQQVFRHFPKCRVKVPLRKFNIKLEREDIFKPTVGNESLHQDIDDNSFRMVKFTTPKNSVVKSMMFPHRNIHKYTCISPDGQTHNQIEHILIDRYETAFECTLRRSFRGADFDTNHHLVDAKVREILAVIKQAAQKFDVEGFKFQEAK